MFAVLNNAAAVEASKSPVIFLRVIIIMFSMNLSSVAGDYRSVSRHPRLFTTAVCTVGVAVVTARETTERLADCHKISSQT
jgi:predicted Na+-dependent transporter